MTASTGDDFPKSELRTMPTSAAGLWRQSLDPRRGPPEPLIRGRTRIPAVIDGDLVEEICPKTGDVVRSYQLPGAGNDK